MKYLSNTSGDLLHSLIIICFSPLILAVVILHALWIKLDAHMIHQTPSPHTMERDLDGNWSYKYR
jgi:hypothetical protein